MIKRISLFVLVLLAFGFFSPWFLGFIFQDIALEEYADLEVKQIVVEENENAYLDLKEIDSVIYSPDEELLESHLSGETWDEDFVSDVLEKNVTLFELLDRASEKTGYQEPGYADISTLTLEAAVPTVLSLPAAARVSALRAIALQKEGKEVEAFEETLRMLKVSQMVQEAQGPLIQELIAITMIEESLTALHTLFENTEITSEERAFYQGQVGGFYEIREGMIEAVKVENLLAHNTLDSLEGLGGGIFGSLSSGFPSGDYYLPGFGLNYYLHPNETKALFVEHNRALIENLQKDCEEADVSERSNGLSPVKMYFTENALGELFFRSLAASQSSWACETEQRLLELK